MRRVGRQPRILIVAAVVYAIALSAALTDYRASAASVETGPPAVKQQPATPAPELAAEIERQIAAGNGCLTCHQPDTLSMHATEKAITCVQCHGGNAGCPGDGPAQRFSGRAHHS